jgi:hypothetical protein
MRFDEDLPLKPFPLGRRQDHSIELNASTTSHGQQIKGQGIYFETLFRGPLFTPTNDNLWDIQDAIHNLSLRVYTHRTKQ